MRQLQITTTYNEDKHEIIYTKINSFYNVYKVKLLNPNVFLFPIKSTLFRQLNYCKTKTHKKLYKGQDNHNETNLP